jgi:hypothetical protein
MFPTPVPTFLLFARTNLPSGELALKMPVEIAFFHRLESHVKLLSQEYCNVPYRLFSFPQWPRFHVKYLLMFCA